MELVNIFNTVMHYGSIILGAFMFLVATVTMIVEVVKRLIPKVPTDLVVFIVSIAVTVLALFIVAAILDVTIMWYYAVGAVVLGIAVAYAAMFGWDRFATLWSRLKNHITGTAENE